MSPNYNRSSSNITMKFLVTDIEFDFDEFGDGNPEWQLSQDDQYQTTYDSLGVWEADDEDDLIEEITTASGWCIKNIDYDIQLK